MIASDQHIIFIAHESQDMGMVWEVAWEGAGAQDGDSLIFLKIIF